MLLGVHADIAVLSYSDSIFLLPIKGEEEKMEVLINSFNDDRAPTSSYRLGHDRVRTNTMMLPMARPTVRLEGSPMQSTSA